MSDLKSAEQWEKDPSMERIKEVIDMVAGKGGKDDESIVHDYGHEKADGFVSLYCGQGFNAARIMRRIGSAVISMKVTKCEGHVGVHLNVDRRAFRGLEYAFKRVDNSTAVDPDE